MKIDEKIHYNVLLFVFKIITGSIPTWVLDMPMVRDQRGRTTRQEGDYIIPRTRTKIAENSLKVRCSVFKNRIKQYVM